MTLPEFKSFPKIPRYSREVIITEKIDGTNASVYISDDGQEIIAGSRMQIETKAGLAGCFMYFVVWTLIAFVGALCLDYDIRFWTKYTTGVEKHMPFLYAMLISYLPIVGQIAVPVAIITFVLSFCL